MKPTVLARRNKVNFISAIGSAFGRLRVIWMMVLAALLLSGCVKYDAGINVENLHNGEIVQHIKLGEQLTSFSKSTVQEYLDSIERRARRLEGRTKRLSKDEMVVNIPFNTGAELESKFNEFFNPSVKKGKLAQTVETVDLPQLESKFKLRQSNLLLFVRNKLIYDVDLRSLGVLSSNGSVIVSPGSLFDLEFSLHTSAKVKSIEKSANAITPLISDEGHKLVWTLKPGELNHIEAVFWLPSPIGIGALVIALLVVVGFYIKYNSLPGMGIGSVKAADWQKVQ